MHGVSFLCTITDGQQCSPIFLETISIGSDYRALFDGQVVDGFSNNVDFFLLL